MDHFALSAVALFKEKFSRAPDVAAFAPGRACLIGDHTDYNDGFVLPFSMPQGTYMVASRNNSEDNVCHIYSSAYPDDPTTFHINKSLQKSSQQWSNYIKGTIYQYLGEIPEKGCGFDAVVVSTVPLGSGLSSSAALEVCTATILEQLFGIHVDGVTKALRCQKAEHSFADSPCGLMDQYISCMGKSMHLLLIDCRSKDYQLIPFGDESSSPAVIIINTMVKHNLSASEYPNRVRQCQEAVSALKKKFPTVTALRDVDMDMLLSLKGSSDLSPVAYMRAAHIIGEKTRTFSILEALKTRDYETVGRLMTQSHHSYRDEYEITCEELDTVVELALKVPGVYGARMTGGGFGGCVVTLMERSAVAQLKETVQEGYFQKFGIRCECYEGLPSDGVKVLRLL